MPRQTPEMRTKTSLLESVKEEAQATPDAEQGKRSIDELLRLIDESTRVAQSMLSRLHHLNDRVNGPFPVHAVPPPDDGITDELLGSVGRLKENTTALLETLLEIDNEIDKFEVHF